MRAFFTGLILFGILALSAGASSNVTTLESPGGTPWTTTYYLWGDPAVLATLDTANADWAALQKTARRKAGALTTDTTIVLTAQQSEQAHVMLMAKALYYVRTGDTTFKAEVTRMLRAAMNTETSGTDSTAARTLDLGRTIPWMCIAYDLIGGMSYSVYDLEWRTWLFNVMRRTGWNSSSSDGGNGSFRNQVTNRPNNWGTYAQASWIAAYAVLAKSAQFRRCTTEVMEGWARYNDYMGQLPRSGYTDFRFASQKDAAKRAEYQYAPLSSRVGMPSNNTNLRPVNPLCPSVSPDRAGAPHPLGGAPIDDLDRNYGETDGSAVGGYQWPLVRGAGVTYSQGAWMAMALATEVLHNIGYSSYAVQDSALSRMTMFLYRQQLAPAPAYTGDSWWPDDTLTVNNAIAHKSAWVIPIVNKRYPSAAFPVSAMPGPVTSAGWQGWAFSGWTHQ